MFCNKAEMEMNATFVGVKICAFGILYMFTQSQHLQAQNVAIMLFR